MSQLDMSDADAMQRAVDAAAASSPVQKPETAVDPALHLDSLGRSMVKKRGRPKGSVNAPKEAKPVKGTPEAEMLTDANVGKAIAGIFAIISLPLGGHWRLFKPEERELGECFGPFARIVGPEAFGHWLTGLTIMPVAINIIAPRLAVQQMIIKKVLPKADARPAILQMKAMMAAEGVIDIERQIAESKEYLQTMVAAAADSVVDNRINEIKGKVVQPNGAVTEPVNA